MFRAPGGGRAMIKRVAGLPGDAMKVRDARIWIGEEALTNSRGQALRVTDATLANYFELYPRVPDGMIFVIGDQTGRRSRDSREFGFVPLADVMYLAEGAAL